LSSLSSCSCPWIEPLKSVDSLKSLPSMAGPSFTETWVPSTLSFLARFSSRDLDDFDEELQLSLSLSPLLLLLLLEGLHLLLLLRLREHRRFLDLRLLWILCPLRWWQRVSSDDNDDDELLLDELYVKWFMHRRDNKWSSSIEYILYDTTRASC
jgi:hypothetical protein